MAISIILKIMDFFPETLNKEQLLELLKEVLIESIKLDYPNKEILTFKEATAYLSLSKSTLYKMTSKREIPFYNPGGKVIYFKRSELDNWVFSGKVAASDDFDAETERYLNRTPKI
jgi:excisionase family DNA binding protein